MSQGDGRDLFGGGETRSDRAKPGAERSPDQRRHRGGEQLKHALGDESELDVPVIGRQFAADGVAVDGRFAVEILVAAFAADGDHGRHPEVMA